MDTKVDQGAETAILEPPKVKYQRPKIVNLSKKSNMATCAPGGGVQPEPEAVCAAGNSPTT